MPTFSSTGLNGAIRLAISSPDDRNFSGRNKRKNLARETTPHRRLYQNGHHAAYPGRSQSLSFTTIPEQISGRSAA
jgi:hypothetical protein